MESLVSSQWLADELEANDLAVLDASHHLPDANRDPRAEFEAAHIPGAQFLDLAGLTDAASPVPAALPSAAQLAERLATLGVAPGMRIVLYDDSALRTSARAWLALSVHGIARVAILDGGLAKWRQEGRPLVSGRPQAASIAPAPLPAAQGIATKAELLLNLQSGAEQVIDARSADRVFGSGEDPVHGGANGRIPGALNLPYSEVLNKSGTYKAPSELRVAFAHAGIDWERPVVTTCGSGITASVLAFALHLAGKDDVRVYDGSWTEWNADPATPKAQGAVA